MSTSKTAIVVRVRPFLAHRERRVHYSYTASLQNSARVIASGTADSEADAINRARREAAARIRDDQAISIDAAGFDRAPHRVREDGPAYQVELHPDDLRSFTGTSTWYRHGLERSMLYTDGVRYFAERAGGGAYWFLDIVATELFVVQLAAGRLDVTLTVTDKAKAVIEARIGPAAGCGLDGVIWRRRIDYTDCPAGVWRFVFVNNVLCLPSED